MRPTLGLRHSQQLSMTPQLQQAIRLLQLSSYELEQVIRNELESNPLLECDPPDLSESNIQDEKMEVIIEDCDFNIYQSLPLAEEGFDFDRHSFANSSIHDISLQQHLLFQMQMTHFSVNDRRIAMTLIDAIDENGYLSLECSEILESLIIQGLNDIEMDEIEAVLHRIQQFDPLGVGARRLAECLSIQLNALPKTTLMLEPAKELVLNYLTLLGKRDYVELKKHLKLNQKDLNQILLLLKQLDPKPGLRLLSKRLDCIVPDVIVRNQNNRLVVELNKACLPRLRLNTDYVTVLKRKDSDQDAVRLRHYINEAQWFLKSIQTRQETLLKVVKCIVEKQQSFFHYGEVAIKPLILQEVADSLELHESTVSRITDQKYVYTPRGVYDLKFFFSNQVNKLGSKDYSATAIRAIIKKLIHDECAGHPLSDSEIMENLAGQGIHIARRTVSKYRIAMNIPASHERRSTVF